MEWCKQTEDGSLSDFEFEPDPKVWQQVCSERGMCSPKLCGPQSDFAKDHGVCFFQRARGRILSADVLVLNHTLFFTLLGGLDEDVKEGVLFRNDFVIFDEAHTVENVAAKHIGLGISSGQMRYALQRLWNPKTEKGLLSTLRKGKVVPFVDGLMKQSHEFFQAVELTCDEFREKEAQNQGRAPRSEDAGGGRRAWTELRIRRPDLVPDTLSLPIQRLREEVHRMIKETEDKDTGEELMECNRRLGELREEVAAFLSQSIEDHVYWVERSGKGQKMVSLHSAPVEVATFLRDTLFGAETSVIMTSATMAMMDSASSGAATQAAQAAAKTKLSDKAGATSTSPAAEPLAYIARRVGAEKAVQLQVGSPFDYERQMKIFVAGKMPDPRDPQYTDALIHWIEHYVRMTHGKAFVLFTNARLLRDIGERMAPFFAQLGVQCFCPGRRHSPRRHAREIQGGCRFGPLWHRQLLAGRRRPRRGPLERHHHPPALRRAGPIPSSRPASSTSKPTAATRSWTIPSRKPFSNSARAPVASFARKPTTASWSSWTTASWPNATASPSSTPCPNARLRWFSLDGENSPKPNFVLLALVEGVTKVEMTPPDFIGVYEFFGRNPWRSVFAPSHPIPNHLLGEQFPEWEIHRRFFQ